MYIYIYTYVCKYTYIHTLGLLVLMSRCWRSVTADVRLLVCTPMSVFICIRMYVCVYMYIQNYPHVCLYARIRACVSACSYISMRGAR